MAAILSAEHLAKSYTLKKLITDSTLYIGEHDRIGVVGINGTGKSTLLKLLCGQEEPDAGAVTRRNGLRVSYLPQMPRYDEARTSVEQVLWDSPKDVGAPDAYEAKALLTQLGITDFDSDVRTFSGGQKKRVALAAALIRPVDLLLLDEPTNHIDAKTVAWLEGRLAAYRGALMMVTHDRYFLDRVCTRIAELSGGELYLHDGNFSYYLEQKAARLDMENAQARKRSAILRRELEWIRRGAQARSTKQKARIQRFEEMSAIEGPQTEARMTLSSTSARLGRKIIECENVGKQMGGRQLFSGFTYTILRDERMAVVGENGCGKTTLLRLLAGELSPDEGRVTIGDTVRVGFFAQEFPKVDPKLRLIDYMRDIAEYVQTPDGLFSASQMLEQFLFPPDVQYTPVERLSGGEKRRLYLASVLMASPNVLLLDEPTNDLDIATLEILESYLEGFEGAVVVVSHDRWFLDRVVSRLFAFDGDGRLTQYVCSFSDYLEAQAAKEETAKPRQESGQTAARRERPRELRMSYKEQREYETIDQKMAELQAKLEEIDAQIERHASDFVKLTELAGEKEETERLLSEAEERWLYLTDLAERIEAQKK
ncbi:MAG: ABC-F family ATP-binding cassette domain-containing protein [Clostridiales bacterium]|nr:ABC-F family ATP-binding cassette domain-containing protein [Clostridiales bacterium]MDY5514027.1 ABC-F family ATP-binding cassette domain-containing protein [Candidatus Ventricola sp.]